ncbi:MAG: hypothetical protein MUE71_03375 [Chitinophagaceae bacterium]|jgi:hypothetical protein|nr:hypothetical protein [Chitinophagaceae bacterium]
MKKITGFLSASAIILAFACGEGEHANHDHGGKSMNAAAEAMSPTDSLFEQVVALHDEAMPKMGKLKGFEDLAKLRIDSLAKLNDSGSKALKAEYEKLLTALQRAQKGMNDWMDGFQPDKYENQDSLMAYYQSEKVRAQAMRDDIFAVMDSATAKFGN